VAIDYTDDVFVMVGCDLAQAERTADAASIAAVYRLPYRTAQALVDDLIEAGVLDADGHPTVATPRRAASLARAWLASLH